MSRGSAASPVRVQGIARSVAGFTVMELILVLVLVSVLTGMAMPPFADWVASSRVENAARVVAGDLQQALTLAARQGKPVRIAFDADELRLEFTDRGTGALLHSRRLGQGTDLPIGSATASGIPADVFPNRVVSEAMSITVSAGSHATRIDMTTAGFIRVVRL